MTFSERTILITGAASGIGAAVSRWLAAHGAQRLVLVDIIEEYATDDFGCDVQTFRGDIGDPTFWETLDQDLPDLDHAVLNAGVSGAAPLIDTSFEEWRRVMSTNLDGAFLSLRTALRKVRDGGSVVLTASVSGLKAETGTAAYATSKAGVLQLTKIAAKEAAPRGVRVNAVAPGGVDTPIWDSMSFFEDLIAEHGGDRAAAIDAMGRAGTPLGRFATVDEIAAQICFLLSDVAATITGTSLVTDGGYSL